MPRAALVSQIDSLILCDKVGINDRDVGALAQVLDSSSPQRGRQVIQPDRSRGSGRSATEHNHSRSIDSLRLSISPWEAPATTEPRFGGAFLFLGANLVSACG
jgi:hypothetical protein